MPPSLVRSGFVLASGILLGRLAGFVRELALAHRLGAGQAADLAIYALTVPDIFTNILVGGAIGAALTPEFTSSPSRSRSLYLQATIITLVAFGALAIVIAFGSASVARLLAPGLSSESVKEAARLGRIVAGVIPLTAAAAVSTAYLQSRDRFLIASLGTLIFNGVLIATLWASTTEQCLVQLSWGALAAAALRWLSQWASTQAIQDPNTERSRWEMTWPIVRRYGEALASYGMLMLIPVLARTLASLEGVGGIALLNYAGKLVELPVGIAVSILAVVLLPRFSALVNDHAATLTLARKGLLITWGLALPFALAPALLSHTIVTLLFGNGQVDPASIQEIANLMAWGLAGIPAQGACHFLFSLLIARKDTSRPFRVGVLAFAIYAGMAWILRRHLGLQGLVIGSVALYWVTAAAYLYLLRRYHGIIVLGGGLSTDILRSALAAGIGFLPIALAAPKHASAIAGASLAGAGVICSAVAMLVPRYRIFPEGLVSFLRRT